MIPVFDDVAWPRHRTRWRANILIDHNGSAEGSDGTSATLTRGRDRDLLRAVRANAQLVITGGRTVRKEGWFFPPHGLLVVMSRSQNLPMSSCPHPERVRIANNLDDVVTIVDERQADRVLCEGGPLLVRMLLGRELLDELFVSVLTGHSDHPAQQRGDDIACSAFGLDALGFELIDMVSDDGITFTRFQHRRVSHNWATSLTKVET